MKQRNPWLDTLKAFAIYLVILGHIINNCIINGYESRLCGILYFTHVPLFLVISGMLVKDKPINTNFLLNLLLRFVVPYTTWSVILTTFYLGRKHLFYDSLTSNIIAYYNNWCHSFLWFIKVYLIVFVLWQILKKFTIQKRFIIGTFILVIFNLITQENKILAELASLSLYAYTLFGAGALLKNYLYKLTTIHMFILLIFFATRLPFATTSNNYFELPFNVIVTRGNWYLFFIRLIAGVCISTVLIYCGKIVCSPKLSHNFTLQSIGKITLQIYLLQSLLVEAILNRIVCLPNNYRSYILAFILAGIITYLSFIIIEFTKKTKVCNFLLWGSF